jgi:hypothetical protein
VKKKNAVLVLCGVLLGCGAESIVTELHHGTAHAAGSVEQYCATTGDYNDIGKLNTIVKQAGGNGWTLVGVYRPPPLGSTFEDYVCFRR